jgi:hypothetical protein
VLNRLNPDFMVMLVKSGDDDGDDKGGDQSR